MGEAIRFGLIGDGRAAARHRKGIERIGGRVEMAYDPRWRETGGCSTLGDEFFDRVDWVVVASPTFTHHAYVKECLRRGKRVICENPYVLPWQPVINSDDVTVVLQLRWLPLPERAREVRVVASRNQLFFNGWEGNQTKELFFNVFIHYIDLASRLGASFEGSVVGEGVEQRWVDDMDLAQFDMDDTYERMYQDVFFRGSRVRPLEVARLHRLLGRCTERFGPGSGIIGKKIRIEPDGYLL